MFGLKVQPGCSRPMTASEREEQLQKALQTAVDNSTSDETKKKAGELLKAAR